MRVDPLTQAYQLTPNTAFSSRCSSLIVLGPAALSRHRPGKIMAPLSRPSRYVAKWPLLKSTAKDPHRLGHQSELALNLLTGNQGLACGGFLLDDVQDSRRLSSVTLLAVSQEVAVALFQQRFSQASASPWWRKRLRLRGPSRLGDELRQARGVACRRRVCGQSLQLRGIFR